MGRVRQERERGTRGSGEGRRRNRSVNGRKRRTSKFRRININGKKCYHAGGKIGKQEGQ